MPGTRRRFTSEFKAKIALEALREDRTVAELSAQHGVHPNQITQWKSQLKQEAARAFEAGRSAAGGLAGEKETAGLFEQIGRLKVEVDFLRKKLGVFL